MSQLGLGHRKAIKEAQKYATAVEVASAIDTNFTTMPSRDSWQIPESSKYLHICTNETIHGVEWFGSLAGVGLPVIADMSSHLLSRSMPIQEFDSDLCGCSEEFRNRRRHHCVGQD